MMADSDESNDALSQCPIEQLVAGCVPDSPDMQSVRSNTVSFAATDSPDVDAMLLELHSCTPSGRPRNQATMLNSDSSDSMLCDPLLNDTGEAMFWAASHSDDVAPTDNTTDTADPKKDVKKCRKRGKRKLTNVDEDPASLRTDVDPSAMEMSAAGHDPTTHKSTRGSQKQRLRATCAWQKRNSVTAADSNDVGGEEGDDRLRS